MDARQTLQHVRDTFSASTVFGDPIDREGVTLVPVARIMGGGGSGQGEAHHERGQTEGEALPTRGTGWGGGYGAHAKALGAFVIRNGDATWKPVVDVNQVILGGQIAGILVGSEIATVVAVLVMRSILRRK